MARSLAITCDAPGCVRGIVAARNTSDFGSPCAICGGFGSLSLDTLCRLLQENDSTVGKLLSGRRVLRAGEPAPGTRMRAKVAARICGKLVDLAMPRAVLVPIAGVYSTAGEWTSR